MNFQAVYIGESVNEPSVAKGGYLDAAATPSEALVGQIEFVDASIGQIVEALKHSRLDEDTLLIISAKHGAAPSTRTPMLRTAVIRRQRFWEALFLSRSHR